MEIDNFILFHYFILFFGRHWIGVMLSLTPSPISRSISNVPHSCKRTGNVPKFPGWDLGIRGQGRNYCGKFDPLSLLHLFFCTKRLPKLVINRSQFFALHKISAFIHPPTIIIHLSSPDLLLAMLRSTVSVTRDVAWVEHKIRHIKRRFPVSFVNWTG